MTYRRQCCGTSLSENHSCQKYGWVSKEFSRVIGTTARYSTPSGKEVEVCCITYDPNDSGGMMWEDIECIGEVSECIRGRGLGISGLGISGLGGSTFLFNSMRESVIKDIDLEITNALKAEIDKDEANIDLANFTENEKLISYLEKKSRTCLYQGESSEANMIHLIIKDIKGGKV